MSRPSSSVPNQCSAEAACAPATSSLRSGHKARPAARTTRAGRTCDHDEAHHRALALEQPAQGAPRRALQFVRDDRDSAKRGVGHGSRPHPRIDQDVGDVGNEIERDVDRRRRQHHALHDRIVAVEHRVDDQLAETRNRKICSVSTAPDSSVPSSSAPSVMTGVSALRMACLRMTERSERPLARAVRT